jgi:mono/diheme cytochrome c family protein
MRKLLARIDRFINRVVKNYTLWVFLFLLAFFVIAVKAWHAVFPLPPEPAVYSTITYLEQGWSTPEYANRREKYYQTAQGNLVAPFSWFMSLERQPQGFPPRLSEVDLFSSPSVQAKYGLLPDASSHNPYALPIGIVKDIVADEAVEPLGEGQREWISISCAACHTGQIIHRGQAVRIDGGQGMWNFTAWSGALVGNLVLTTTLPDRFDRFAKRVFAWEGRNDSKEARADLRRQMKRYLNSPLIVDALNAILNHTYPTQEGPTRTAALGRGVNGEFGLLDSRNIVQNRGPVSYPPLWYTHDFDWVQSVAAINQPMGRNITEAWGVNVQVKLDEPKRWLSTARLRDLYWIESLLSTLKAPPWPQEVFGRLDTRKDANGHYLDPTLERGRFLYEEAEWPRALSPQDEQLSEGGGVAAPVLRANAGYCARCHAPTLQPEAAADKYGNRYIQLPMYRLDVLGTDPYDAKEFAARQPYTGILADTYDNKPRWPNVKPPLETVTSNVEKKWYDDRGVPEWCREVMNGFRPNLFRAPLGYPARPLAGYWATGPYLHNGSVRTLYQLLSPADQREKTFWVSTFEFDPVEVGYLNKRIDGAFQFDTRVPGNSNAGHEFNKGDEGTSGVIGPFLPPSDRRAIVAYMKVMNDVDDSAIIKADALARRDRILEVMKEEYEDRRRYVPNEYDPADQLLTKMPEFCEQLRGVLAGNTAQQSYMAGVAPATSAPAPPAAEAPTPTPTPAAPAPGGGR